MSRVERVETIVDGMTGELLSEQRNIIAFNPIPPEPAYAKLYVEDLGKLLDLQSGHGPIKTRREESISNGAAYSRFYSPYEEFFSLYGERFSPYGEDCAKSGP
jgi:hypothetical protein